ncbi:MAG: hypothetical protein QOD53_2515, partial [Thermoleophilaceae bacterium]|nr:hypothetical protein [Thermoleophilaceae bacterium]
KRCTASDLELEARGPDACPAGSRIGGGSVEGLFEEPVGHDFLVDHYKHTADVMNGAGQQIVLIKSEGYTVVRGRFRPDGSIEFVPTTCFPAPPAGGCADDYIRQLKASSLTPAYTRTSGGRVRSYATTPPRCPARRYWRMGVRFWWSDGSVDSLVNKEPCTRPRKRHRRGKKVADERTRH